MENTILNAGSSWGLKYPFVFGRICGYEVVWCRHCGIIFYEEYVTATSYGESLAASDKCAQACRHLNGLSNEMDPEVLAAIDATP